MIKRFTAIFLLCIFVLACKNEPKKENVETMAKVETPFVWEGANIYFLLTDRFNNGDASNDVNFDRTKETAVLRGFEGGDIKGVIQKIKDGYFTDLGINAIWLTPIVEQIHGATDEGTGATYGYHGYWTKDWTSLDPNFGTKEDLKEMIQLAHAKGIRVLLDAVINHTGPVTEKDSVWPDEWVRTGPACSFDSFDGTVSCTLVENLPDVKTESNELVELPPQLVEKWKAEGRYEQEVAELTTFFDQTGLPKAPRFYIMKWLADYITKYGIDGYRVDTVKHTEPYVWQEFKKVCDSAFSQWKTEHPDLVLDANDFYLVGEVYNYNISHTTAFDFGDRKVNYFDSAFNSLINFEIKWNAAQMSYEDMFSKYNQILQNELKGYGVLNYLTSHDDGAPFDKERSKPYEAANKLLLCPGTSQVYYGDESARPLIVEGANGDANLRSNMNWEAIQNNPETQAVLKHWQKLGTFRANHPAIGAGVHQMISQSPYVFSRNFVQGDYKDEVLIGLDLPTGEKVLDVGQAFDNGAVLHEAYSDQIVEVKEGKVTINSEATIVLLEKQ